MMMEVGDPESVNTAGALTTKSGHLNSPDRDLTVDLETNSEQVEMFEEIMEHSAVRDEEKHAGVDMTKNVMVGKERAHIKGVMANHTIIDVGITRTECGLVEGSAITAEQAYNDQDVPMTSDVTEFGVHSVVRERDASMASDHDNAFIKEEFDLDNIINPNAWPEHVVVLDDDEAEVEGATKTMFNPRNADTSNRVTSVAATSLSPHETIIIPEINQVPVTMNSVPSFTRTLLRKKKPLTAAEQETRIRLQQEIVRKHVAAHRNSATYSGRSPIDVLSNGQPPGRFQQSHDVLVGEQLMDYPSTAQEQSMFIGPVVTRELDPREDEELDTYQEMQAALAEAAAAESAFKEAKQRYRSKKQAGQNTREDDINYLTLKSNEQIRQKRFKDHQTRTMEISERALRHDDSDDDVLFVSTGKKESSFGNVSDPSFCLEQQRVVDIQQQTMWDDQAPKQSRRKKRQSNKVSEDAINAGMEPERMKEMRRTRKGRGTDATKPSIKGSGRKTKAGKVRKPEKLGRSRPRSLFKNFNSLFTSNVYADGNRNHGITLPTSSQKDKRKALNEIVAAIPLDDKTTAQRDANDLITASKTLGPRQCSRDPISGDFKLKGMISFLRPYQVLAAAAMKDREDGITQPAGGILGDEMGFGKTVTTIATMIANPPPRNDECKTTLIVLPASLLSQWQEEIWKHADRARIGKCVVYHSLQRLDGPSSEDIYKECDVILTTYGEVVRSYPKFNPPQELMTFTAKREWFKQQLEEQRGLLHRIHYYRIVLDEAQAIKNHLSQTSIAVRSLEAKFRWAISGTPIQNSVDELYPYFKFLRVKYSGSIDVFRKNFCERGSADICNARVQALLKSFLIRRTHADTLMGQKLVQLPDNHVRTVHVDFTRVERYVYDTIRKRFIHRINSYSKAGDIKLKYNNVLTMLLVLRQLCSHLYLVQDIIEDIFLLEDFEKLWHLTADEVSAGDRPSSRDMLAELSVLLQTKEQQPSVPQARPQSPLTEAADQHLQQNLPLVFRFRQHLRDLANSENFTELRARSVCSRCKDYPFEPFLTSCNHIYCKECLTSMSYEASLRNEDRTECLICGDLYESSSACPALKELGFDEATSQVQNDAIQEDQPTALITKRSPRWIETGRSITPSSKAAAVVAQIRIWLQEDPACKIVVFTQFRLMIQVLGKLCGDQQWGYCVFHGGISHQTRSRVLKNFRDKEETHIMIASLKCGGVGLNLTMATRVICIDPWWNSPVEQQAFCRVYRIGQTQETYITRIVVKDSVDNKLLKLQEDKATLIKGAMGDDGKRVGKLSIKELMRLFGTLSDDNDDEDGPEFIIVEGEPEPIAHMDEEYGREVPTHEDVVMLH